MDGSIGGHWKFQTFTCSEDLILLKSPHHALPPFSMSCMPINYVRKMEKPKVADIRPILPNF